MNKKNCMKESFCYLLIGKQTPKETTILQTSTLEQEPTMKTTVSQPTTKSVPQDCSDPEINCCVMDGRKFPPNDTITLTLTDGNDAACQKVGVFKSFVFVIQISSTGFHNMYYRRHSKSEGRNGRLWASGRI